MTYPTDGPSAPPQLSPDGQWWWNGQEWVPAQQPVVQEFGARPKRRSRLAIWLVAGAAALVGLFVLAVLAIALFMPVGTQIDMGSDPELAEDFCEFFPEDC